MKRLITVMATALLASSLLAGAADARGFGGGGHIGGFGGGGHVGGIGGEHMGGLGDRHVGAVGAHGFGLHQHASHRFGGYGPGYGYYSYPDCYDWYYLHPDQPLPLSCS